MTDTAWMRFQKIIYDGVFVTPVPPYRIVVKDGDVVVNSYSAMYSYEVVDAAASKTGFDGWMIHPDYPKKEGEQWIWKLVRP